LKRHLKDLTGMIMTPADIQFNVRFHSCLELKSSLNLSFNFRQLQNFVSVAHMHIEVRRSSLHGASPSVRRYLSTFSDTFATFQVGAGDTRDASVSTQLIERHCVGRGSMKDTCKGHDRLRREYADEVKIM
jgi:hypothetical protein